MSHFSMYTCQNLFFLWIYLSSARETKTSKFGGRDFSLKPFMATSAHDGCLQNRADVWCVWGEEVSAACIPPRVVSFHTHTDPFYKYWRVTTGEQREAASTGCCDLQHLRVNYHQEGMKGGPKSTPCPRLLLIFPLMILFTSTGWWLTSGSQPPSSQMK